MKETKICIIATVITMIILISCACAMPAYAMGELELHPKLAVVVGTAKVENLWLVSCEDQDGQIWAFWDDEDRWQYGDIVNLIMTTRNEVINAYYEGHIKNVEYIMSVLGWR